MSGAMDVDEQNRQGRTKLHRACIAGSSQRVKELLANNATVDLEDSRGDTGLNMAAHTGAFVVMKLLIGAKADTNHQNKYGYSVLHSIAGSAKPTPKNYRTRSHAACVKVLIEAKADVNIQNRPGRTAFQSARGSRSVAEARLLLEAKADVNHKEKNGWTSLHEACHVGNAERVRLLIKSKADVDLQDARRRTGLIHAAWKGHPECLKLVIDAKADMNHQDKEGGWSGLHLACWEGNVECVRLLVESKADVFLQDEDGRTALDLAVVYCGQRNVPLTLFDLVLGAIEAAADPYNLRPTILSAPITKWLRTGDLSARTGRHDRMFLALVYAGAIVTPKEFEELSEAGQTLLAEYDDRVARTLRASEPRHNSLYTTLYRDVEVDTRIGLCAMGLYDEPLERVMEYVGFRIHGRPFVSTGHRGAPEITQHALNDGNGNWRHLEEYTEQRR